MSGYTYVVDMPTFRKYLQTAVDLAKKENLEMADESYIYKDGEKRVIQIFNLDATGEGEGFIYCYKKEEEFHSLDELIEKRLFDLPQYFKLVLPYGDDVFLNEYKEAHPELNPEEY